MSVLESEGEKLSSLVEREKEQIESLEQIIAVIDRLVYIYICCHDQFQHDQIIAVMNWLVIHLLPYINFHL